MRSRNGIAISKRDFDVIKAAEAYVKAQMEIPDVYDWGDPRIDELLDAREALIKAVNGE